MSDSLFGFRRLVGLAVGLAALALPGRALAAVTMQVNPGVSVSFTNSDATYTIFTGCGVAPNVGPGYVAQVQMSNDGRVVVDGTGANAPLAATATGLGVFDFKAARAAQGSTLTQGSNAWDVLGTTCVQPGSGAGVDATANNAPYNGTPTVDSSGVGKVDEVVYFRDPYGTMVKVFYRWRFYDNYVKLWADAYEPCYGGPGGSCGSPAAWVKGPKFVAGLNGHPDGPGFTQLNTYLTSGSVASNTTGNHCIWDGPTISTPGSCGDATRARLEWNYTSPTSPVSYSGGPNCSSSQRCFDAVFRGYNTSGTSFAMAIGNPVYNWATATSSDMTEWANVAASQPELNTNVPGTCSNQTSPTAPDSLKWEEGGAKYDSNGDRTINYLDDYQQTYGYFFAWRDCVNVVDNGTLWRAYDGPMGYGTYAGFSFDDGSGANWSATMNG